MMKWSMLLMFCLVILASAWAIRSDIVCSGLRDRVDVLEDDVRGCSERLRKIGDELVRMREDGEVNELRLRDAEGSLREFHEWVNGMSLPLDME